MVERFQTFTVLIAKINRSIRRIKTETMNSLNLKSPHVSCIYYLYPNKTLTVRELCDVCDEDKGAISRSISYLVNNGFIEYEKVENKKYKNKLVLTEKGIGVAKLICDKILEVLSTTGDGIGEDMAVFYRCLETVNNKLEICIGGLTDSSSEEK